MTDQPPEFVETLLGDTDAVAALFSNALADAAMASIERATSEARRPLNREDLRSAVLAGISGYLASEIAAWRERKSSFTCRFDPMRCRLFVTGAELELATLRSLIVSNPRHRRQIDTIAYNTPAFTLLLTGKHLRQWLAGDIYT